MKEILLAQTIAMAVFMTAWFGVAVARRRNDVADIAWGLGFIFSVLMACLALTGAVSPRGWLLATLVTLWGLRLAVHIGSRNRGKGEDRRYRKWREEWGRYALIRAYFQVFLLQGGLILIISLPVTWSIAASPSPWIFLDAVGLLAWTVGFVFETVSDYQLKQFKKNPGEHGRFMQTGLWRYSRHPNYFGEVTLWWGAFLVALGTPGAWWTVIGPATITFLILYVSGIPLMEEKYMGDPEFEAYRARTSAFFPMPPRTGG